jgi:hypothetical protein
LPSHKEKGKSVACTKTALVFGRFQKPFDEDLSVFFENAAKAPHPSLFAQKYTLGTPHFQYV